MIKIEGQLCYSPLPPASYGRPPIGHGPYCRDDIQMWNLMYISYPELDGYLEPGVDHLKLMQSLPMIMVGGPRAALYGVNNLDLFPYLRSALKQRPCDFLKVLWTMQWPLLPMALHDTNWIDTVSVRAMQIEEEDIRVKRERVLADAGNVKYIKFGKET